MPKVISDEDRFPVNRVLGNIAKEIVRGLLDEAGYRTYPYGYESFLSEIRTGIRKTGPVNSDATERIRSHPDLVVHDHESNDLWIVEVKYRDVNSLEGVGLKRRSISWYQKYWNDSVLVLVVPVEKVFYAQQVSALQRSDAHADYFMDFDLDSDFLPITKIFPKVSDSFTDGAYAKLAKRMSRIVTF